MPATVWRYFIIIHGPNGLLIGWECGPANSVH